MKKTLRLGLNVCAIFLIASCGTGCKNFEWEANPYLGDSKKSQLTNFKGETVSCNQPAFDEMTCFDAQNIADLKTAIEKVKMKKDDRKKITRLFQKIIKK